LENLIKLNKQITNIHKIYKVWKLIFVMEILFMKIHKLLWMLPMKN